MQLQDEEVVANGCKCIRIALRDEQVRSNTVIIYLASSNYISAYWWRIGQLAYWYSWQAQREWVRNLRGFICKQYYALNSLGNQKLFETRSIHQTHQTEEYFNINQYSTLVQVPKTQTESDHDIKSLHRCARFQKVHKWAGRYCSHRIWRIREIRHSAHARMIYINTLQL